MKLSTGFLLSAAAVGALALGGGDAPPYPDPDPRNRGQSRSGPRMPRNRTPKEPNEERRLAAKEKRARRAAKRLEVTP